MHYSSNPTYLVGNVKNTWADITLIRDSVVEEQLHTLVVVSGGDKAKIAVNIGSYIPWSSFRAGIKPRYVILIGSFALVGDRDVMC